MDWKELEGYRPIPWGGPKLLGFLFVGLLFATICFFLSQTNWDGPPMVIVGRIAAYLVLAVIGVLLVASYSAFWKFLGYWRLNIRSYDACFWIKNDEGVDPDIGVQVMERHRSLYWMPCEANERRKIFLRVPLGGWFRRRGLLYRIGGEYPNLQRTPFRAWRIKVRQPITDPLTGSYVEIIDDRGNRVPLTVSATLRFAEWLSAGGIQEWRHEVPDLLRAVFENRAELNKTRDERDEAQQQLGQEIGLVNEWAWKYAELLMRVIDRLDVTKRFIKSKEALRIRQYLIDELDQRLPSDDPRREKYGLAMTAKCAVVSQSTAVAEAREGG